jgi:hypothetical protein
MIIYKLICKTYLSYWNYSMELWGGGKEKKIIETTILK